MATKQAVRLDEAAKILGIGRNSAYAAAKSGDLPAFKVGGIWLVSKVKLDEMLGVKSAD